MSIHSNSVMTEPRLQPDPEVICQRMGTEIVLLHLRTDRFYELNHTAARLWELLSQKCDLALIHETLLSEFEVDPGQLANEIRALLASLKSEGLIIDSDRLALTREEE
ncbi:MAG: PqqD family protein [Acidobacteria bacterium]|nr:PqqD family protein [Acidobacteriota bacterium]MCI0626358.1 PqqD family protein [Acidobacteriota bacterium]